MGEASEGQGHIEPAALVKHAQSICACACHRHSLVKAKRHRCPHPRHHHQILAWHRQTAEIRFINMLVWCRGIQVAHVLVNCQRALVHLGAALGIDYQEFVGGNWHLALIAKVITDCRFLGVHRQVPFLVDVNRRAVAQRIGHLLENQVCWPEGSIIDDLNRAAVGDRIAQLKVQVVADSQIPV